jgi:glycosyltransferase involved in cell wall biosynthesis
MSVPIREISSRPPSAPRPKVSVAMITYNHEKYITQAVESVMMQQTKFPYELVIGEDCSPDRTREICLSLQAKYPDRIRLLLPERNLGARTNEAHVFRACYGDYIALLEGDDFWLHPQKVQRQVDFLENNPNCSACFTLTRVVSDGEGTRSSYIPAKATPSRLYNTEDLIEKNSIATCSLLFRNILHELDLAPFSPVAMSDWPLNVLLSLRGSIGYLNEAMAAYRQHDGGIWTGRAEPERLAETVMFYCILKQLLASRYTRQLDERIVKTHQLIALELLKRGDRRQARARVFQSVASIPLASLFSFGWYVKRSAFLFLGVLGLPLPRVEAALRR